MYAEAIRLFQAAHAPIEVVRASIGHLMARASLGEPIGAAEIDQTERDLDRLPLNEQGQLARNLANICLNQDGPARAERLYQRARDAFVRLKRPVDVASADMNRAVAAHRGGDPQRILPVVLKGRSASEIPLFLQPRRADHYVVEDFTIGGAEDLLRRLTGQPRHLPPPPGEAPILPPVP